ncbi:MAG: hypothetical protein AB8H12_24505 [Lewinella sp.]
MKNLPKTLFFFFVFSLLLVGETFAQIPEAFKYQAVVRTPDNTPIINQSVSFRISILEGSPEGAIVYQEAHSPTTSSIGTVSLNVGEGTPLTNIFADIAWRAGDYYMQVEVDVSGGTSYLLLGTSQLLSVPYALYAKEAESVVLTAGEGININGNEISNSAPSQWLLSDDLVFVAPPKRVAIGVGADTMNVPADNHLFVNGNIRVANDSNLVGVDEIIGFDDIRLAGSPGRQNDMHIASNGRVTFAEEVGINQTFSFVDLNVRNQPGNGTVFQVEDTSGVDLFEVGRNGNVGINEITNNVTLQVQNKSVGTNNIIANFERANGDNVLQIQDDRDVVITGDFSVTGNKNFVLDHPLDPANKTLSHNAVESPDRVTYYDGTVRLNADGEAVVKLPAYFEALNGDCHYQLTCIGGFAQVYVKTEISGNQFSIAGGRAGMKVSWQVSARRDDPWAKAHSYEAEEDKDPIDKGKYYYPEGYGKGNAFKIGMKESIDEEPKED